MLSLAKGTAFKRLEMEVSDWEICLQAGVVLIVSKM